MRIRSELEKFEMDSDGYKNVLRSDGVRADLQARAERIAARAASMYNDADSILEVKADSYIGKGRAGATAIAIGVRALEIEAERRVLGSSMEAGR
jgi:hypothetical protein